MLALASLTSSAFTSLNAQEVATGTVSGSVVNASNGQHLRNAIVTVEGTSRQGISDDFGNYEIRNVPVGEVTLRATYLGEDAQTATVTVTSGAKATQDFTFRKTEQMKTDKDGTILLDPYVVNVERYKNAQAIALAEERNSVNIKNVVSADQFGDIPGGNVGEFIKYLPGIELEYGGTYIAPTDAFGISVRGFGSADTAIYIDGVPISSASQASLTTQIGLDMMSINNASRVELIKVPTPDMKMNSVGGQINLISKSAFEYLQPSFTWKVYTVVNSEHPNPFEKVAGPKSKKVYAGQPGFELSYIKPVSRTFGISLTASAFSQYTENRRFRPEWGTASVTNIDLRPFGGTTGTTLTNNIGPAGLNNPYFTRASVTDSPRTNTTLSASMKADWRPFDGLTVTGSYQVSKYKAADAARRLQLRTQRPQVWNETTTLSYPYLTAAQSANGAVFNPSTAVDMNIDARDKEGMTHTGYLKVNYIKGPWTIKTLASASTSRASFQDLENGHFSTVDVSAGSLVGGIKFENIKAGLPGKITVNDRNGGVFDYTKLVNWSTPTIQARSGKSESMDDVFNYKLDVRRELDFIPWNFAQFAFQAGFLREETLKRKWGVGTNYRQTYVGPTLTVNDYLDTTYTGRSPGFGFAPQEWISVYRLYDIYAAHPEYFNANSNSDQVENWNSLVGQNKKIKQTDDSWYAMVEAKALSNRLNIIAGLRQETSSRTGFGPQIDGKWNYVKEKDGTLYRNSALTGTTAGTVRIDQAASPLFAQTTTGSALRSDLTAKGIAFPTDPILSGTVAAQVLQRRLMQPVYGESKGDPSYSINLSYEFTKKIVGKMAYSRTFGRIPLEDGTAGILTGGTSFNINEAETRPDIPSPGTPVGTIAVANPNLLPEIADNWDFAVTYYTDTGGKFGVSYFLKNIKNFSETFGVYSDSPDFGALMDSLGLDPAEYEGWNITTSLNGIGVGKVHGWEFEVSQDFGFIRALGPWGKRFNMFATYSHTEREETNTTRISARPAASNLATAGLNFATNRFSFNIKATQRSLTFIRGEGNFTINGTTIQLGSYTPESTKVDATFNWQFAKKYSFYVTGRDVFASGSESIRRDRVGIYPSYAHYDDYREFGTQLTFGIKGSF